ncbi:hypothetical protein D3C87_1239710 [compost metagenome]
MAKTSALAAARTAKQQDARARKAPAGNPLLHAPTADSFVNFAHKLGVGADNALTAGSYGFNPVTRNRIQLEWIHRGSWLGGVAVDVVADDMTRSGVDFKAEMDPVDQGRLERCVQSLGVWDRMNETIKWGRLYGGSVAVLLVDGQDMKTPLRIETVGVGQFKGLLPLDRWMLEPSLEDLVTDFGPDLGKPKYYKVTAGAPALRGATIHYSRLAGRFVGIELPYQQALTENLWGISVLERLYDRMVAFDSASMGAAQLVFKAHLRTLSIDGFRDIVAAGGTMMRGVLAYTEMMRRFQGIEGITLLDAKDKFEVQATSAFSGVADVIDKLADQLSGALQVPKTRLFGASAGGLSGKDDSGERTYYDKIRQEQRRTMSAGITAAYRLTAASEGIVLPDDFALDFSSLVELNEQERAEVAAKTTEAVVKALDSNLVSQRVAMQELRQSSRITGIFNTISAADIEAADESIEPPVGELELMQMQAGIDAETQEREAKLNPKGDKDGNEQQRQPAGRQPVDGSTPRRKLVR